MSILGFSDPLFRELLAAMPEDERLSSMHVVDEHGRVFSAGDAVIKMMWVFPTTRWRARMARWIPPVRRKVAREYQRLADRRAELSAKVPDAEPTTVRPRWINLRSEPLRPRPDELEDGGAVGP